ncbi:MAG: ABC transporter substrate-binding protein [Butyrivibrio sp.]|uniref:ABC transporter substrate-binding protein n=1 Tax=Butyrivibrio sp. TaxID=28121 RepID=UPI0025D608C9|nr:ABC transporter substrate-binding protein [Butyrivibrio sp.]MCR5772759.1 ABC transporter substrate-binding protein [Butyrivibrio sp.]
MKKKLLSISMCAVMALSLISGCGAKSESGSDSSSSSTDVFKIGAIGPFTGGAAAYGNAVQWGAQIAVDEINEAGGINGYKIEYKAEDDELDNQKSVNAYNTLKDWGAQFIVGSTTSACSIAVSDETHNDNIFQITPSGSAVDCVKYDNVFRVCFSDPAQGTASAQYIGEKKLATKVAIIYDSSDVYSSGITETFVAEAANQGLEIVSQEAFTADSKTDFSVQIQKAIDGQAELIFLPIYYSEAALILQQASTMGVTATFFGCDGMDGILGVENFDTSLAEGLMLLTPFSADATDDLTQNFVTKFQEAHEIVPNQFAADAYDAVYAIKAAIEQAGITPDMSASDICDSMKTAMTQITVDGLTSSGMTWTAEGEPSKEPKAVVITNGEYSLAE